MPTDNRRDETDGDPKTVYEDTKAHDRTGFYANDKKKIKTRPRQPK